MDKTGCLQKRIASIVMIIVSFVVPQGSRADEPSSKSLLLDNPYWNAELDAGGYSDVFWWEAVSPRHNYTRHEMLSGEWGAAIYYDGIATGTKAMWLTDMFLYPNWTTNSDFRIASDPDAWDDPNPPSTGNPVVGNDTGTSTIENSQVTVRIDYEMVDLGPEGPYSPLAFGSFVGADAFVYSERYILLQTYTITNRTAVPITNLQFYQMLHGHPANEGNGVVYSVYDDTDHPDPLASYEPHNDVHCEEGSTYAGNFRYDITQWNNVDDPDKRPQVDHRDWIGFSSTVEPDLDPEPAVENGYYAGGHFDDPPYKPSEGTHVNIEVKKLNGMPYSSGEVAGAMGWELGTLAPGGQPGDSDKITLAIMFGAGPVQRTCDPFEPVAQWGLDEGSGSIAYDSIGDNDGTLIGDPQWAIGFHGGALEFDGDGDYVKLDHGVGALTGASVTISAWVNPGQNMITDQVYGIVSQTKNRTGYTLCLQTDGIPACRPSFRLNNFDVHASSGDEIDVGEWVWLVGTHDGTTLRLYVDGQLKATDDSAARGGVYADAYIGHLDGYYALPFIGLIDDVRVLACAWDGLDGCLPFCHEDYFDWVLLGRPECWCTDYQCDGDAALDTQVPPINWRVYSNDLVVVADNWQKKAGDPGFNACADIDHKSQVIGWRVYSDDMAILSNNWQKFDYELAGDCATRGCGGATMAMGGNASMGLTTTGLLDWLAEIWLDPAVQESLSAEAWLKIYRSLEKEAEKE